MNHVYRTVFNRVLGVWQAVAETARAHGKCGGRTALAAALSLPGLALASPDGAQVVAGSVGFERNGSTLNIHQHSHRAVVDWRDFSIGRGERVSLRQPGSDAAMLARVIGNSASRIDGSLEANGHLYLVNRNGIVVGPQGVINAAGFMASTLDVRNDEFMAGGGLRFFGDSRAGIVNLGSIQADAGNATLVAHSVRNDGSIRAPRGAAELLAAQEVFLAAPDAPALLVSLGEDAASGGETGAANTGLIEAAQARMQAADGNMYALAINQSGVIRATGVSTTQGRIVLTADGGTVRQDGRLEAQNADGSGGDILVGGDYQGGNAAVANAARTDVTRNARMDASATAASGDGGRVIVWADEHTRFEGGISARGGERGGDGGFVEVSGKRTLDFRPSLSIDLSAKAGKVGTVLLDPDEIEVVGTVNGPNQVAVADVEAGLASANYVLDTSSFDPTEGSGNITISSDLNWASTRTLTLKSGNAIEINADITATSGTLDMKAGREAQAPSESGLDDIVGGASLLAGKTITVNTLRYGANAGAAPAGYTQDPDFRTDAFWADGNLRVDTLELDLSGGTTGLETFGSANVIGAFRTVGSGPMGWVEITNHGDDLDLYLNSSDAYGMQIVTPGDLTLKAGSGLASDWGSFVLASTGGNFINQAGSDALDLSGNASFLIYTGSQVGTQKGGLDGTEEFSRDFAVNPPEDYNDNISRFLYRAAFSPVGKELTYRADDLSRLYGSANPGLSYTVGGLQDGDQLADVVTGAPLLTTTATMASGVGNYAINIEQGTLASSTYGFGAFIPGTLTVQPAPLSVDIANASRYYGDVNPAFGATATGLKNGDTLASALAGWSLVSSATRASNVGGYAITSSRNAGDVNPNYNLAFNRGTLTILQTPVTLTLGASSMVYGDALPDFRALATLAGTYNGDTVATAFPSARFGTAATSASSVGSYAVDAIGGFSNPNYLLTLGSLGALAITKARLTVNAHNASRVYGDANPEFSVASVTGWRNGDTPDSIPGLQLTSAASASSNVGDYAIVPSGGASNYEFIAGSGTLTINKAPVEVWLNAATRYYGDTDPQFGATYYGLKNGETALPGLNPVSNTDKYSKVGNHVISAGGQTIFQNYLPTFYAGVLTIAPRPLSIDIADASRTYGEANPWLHMSVSGATEWDAEQASKYFAASTAATQRSDAGDYLIGVAPSVDGIGFDNLGNYQLLVNPGTLHIARAAVNVVANPVSILWGDDLPPWSYTVSGFMPWNDINSAGKVLLTSAAGGTAAQPGRYAITLTTPEVGSNYLATLQGAPYVDVQKRQIFLYGDYQTTVGKVSDIHAGRLEPFTVTKYDTDGSKIELKRSSPFAEGPQFTVLSSSDGQRYTLDNGDLFVRNYESTPFINPIMGTSMDDVLRYYDPVSVPGTAHAIVSLNPENNIIYRDVQVENLEIELEKPAPLQVKSDWPMGENPNVDMMFNSLAQTPTELRSLYEEFRDTGMFDAIGQDAMQLLRDADANEKAYATYKGWIEETEAWIADVKRNKPPYWEEMVAVAEADIVGWRAEMQKNPGLEVLRQRAIEGDPLALTAMAPLLTAGLMKSMQEGKLPPAAEAQMLEHINQQRADLNRYVDDKYDAFLAKQDMREGQLITLFSGTKMPDIVGQAYTDLAADQAAKEMTTTVFVSSGVAGGIVAGVAVSAAVLSTTLATTAKAYLGALISSVGSMGAAMPWAIAGAAVVIIGVAEGVQVVETEKNAARYQSFKESNKQLNNLDNFDLNNKDNAMQASQAIQALVLQSLAKSMVVPQGDTQ